MRFISTFIVSLLFSAQVSAQSVSFDSALHENGVSPGVTITAPLTDGGLVDLSAHVGRAPSDATRTQVAIRFNAPRVWRLGLYLNTGLESITGSVGVSEVLAMHLQPGVDVTVGDQWGFGFKTPSFRFAHLVDRTNPYSEHTKAVFYLFGRW